MTHQSYNKENAYRIAREFAASHYENFPVISWFVKKSMRDHVAIIYWFARTADDFSDEGDRTPGERMNLLNDFEERFLQALKGNYRDAFDFALANTIQEKNLSEEHFLHLLKAFMQDVTVNRYNTHNELHEYCRHSANPVGRLILELYGINDEDARRLSDDICTALQITNFLQDVSVDIKKDRIYIPKTAWAKRGVKEEDYFSNSADENFKSMIRSECEKVGELFDEGAGLLKFLSGRIRIEIAWTILGGMEILNKIAEQDFDVLTRRPVLKKSDILRIVFRAFFYGR